MKITLTEALRLKNELSKTVSTLTYKARVASFGITKEDGETISKDDITFLVVRENLTTALKYSELLNNQISDVNKSLGIDKLVRKLQNAKLLLEIHNNSLDKAKPTTQKRFETLSTVRKSVTITYEPFISSSELKESIKYLKEEVRLFQRQIETLNQNEIDIEIEYSDIESLVL